jgi:hypothetical protein
LENEEVEGGWIEKIWKEWMEKLQGRKQWMNFVSFKYYNLVRILVTLQKGSRLGYRVRHGPADVFCAACVHYSYMMKN